MQASKCALVAQLVERSLGKTEVALEVNTQGLQVKGVEVVFNLVTDAVDVLNVYVPSDSGLRATEQEVQKTADGYLVRVVTAPQNSAQFFSSTSKKKFLIINFQPTKNSDMKLVFDQEHSHTYVANVTPLRDELNRLPQLNFSVTKQGTISSSGNVAVKQCNQSCSSNAECPVEHRCFENKCRLAINVSSDSCTAPADKGLQRSCNQYCADSRECASGYTCFFNRCRAPENPDSATCVGLGTVTATQTSAQSCNQSCTANRDCAVNHRCYNGQCRWATNPGSITCSPATVQTVSQIYSGTGGQKGDEIDVPSGLPTSPSPSATVSGNLRPTASASAFPVGYMTSPSPRALASITPTPSPAGQTEGQANLFFAGLLQQLEQQGIYLPQLAIMVGVGLFLLAVLALLLGRRRGGSPKAVASPSASQDQPKSEYENQLQSKINELKAKSHEPAPTPPPTPNKPVSPMPSISKAPIIEKTEKTAPSVAQTPPQPQAANDTMGPPPSRIISQNPAPRVTMQSPQVATQPATPAPTLSTAPSAYPPSTNSASSSSMLQRLRSKGVIDQKMPNPTRTS